MCGVVGIFRPGGATEASLRAPLAAMTASLSHRGPDDGGAWLDTESGVALGHRRLSIIDLSPAGHQPMTSADGRMVITYNGEVYNAAELRAELGSRIDWRGHSDTEAILEHCAAFGVEATVSRLIGMFAFALWDRTERRLWLVRDRFGIKPLYWGWAGGSLVFGSELKALRAHPNFDAALDRNSLAAYFRFAYVPAPGSIYRDANKLEPGHILRLDFGGKPVISAYWSVRDVARTGLATPFSGSDGEATDALDALLRDAIGRRMVADVPLGAFLSGGVDSSVVVALMQAQSARPVKTFTIGFDEAGYDESAHARAVAAHLGTDHTELRVQPHHALEVVPRLADWYDEPFADSSQIPTFLVSELTRRHVTVSLSGDGGDELFAGYERYRWSEKLWRAIGWMPLQARRALARSVDAAPGWIWEAGARVAPAKFRPSLPADKARKLAEILALPGSDAFYRRLVSCWPEPERLVPGSCEPKGILWDETLHRDIPEFMDRMQVLDACTYLPDDILTKVDRASMAVSLEARVPLLDHRVAAMAFSLPRHMRLRGGTSKWLLRQVLYRYVPEALIERPKMGFGVPVGQWLRGPLRDWAEDLLDVGGDGTLDMAAIRSTWSEHLAGQRDRTSRLWTVLMFRAWERRWSAK